MSEDFHAFRPVPKTGVIYVTTEAQKLGFTVLTANVADFDVLLQLVPAGRALFYRRAGPR